MLTTHGGPNSVAFWKQYFTPTTTSLTNPASVPTLATTMVAAGEIPPGQLGPNDRPAAMPATCVPCIPGSCVVITSSWPVYSFPKFIDRYASLLALEARLNGESPPDSQRFHTA